MFENYVDKSINLLKKDEGKLEFWVNLMQQCFLSNKLIAIKGFIDL